MYPNDYKYSKEHEWVKVEGDIATIGITHFAQEELGDVVFVEFPATDEEFAAGDVFGSVESVKAVSDLFIPVGGTVIEVNEGLNDEPELVNNDPHGKAWMIKVKISDVAELDDLLDSAAYLESLA